MAAVRHLNLFPFCVRISEPQNEPFPNLFSAKLSPLDACKLFWRIKQWKLEVLVVREPFAANFSDVSFVDVVYQPEVNIETDLIRLVKNESQFPLTILKSDPNFDLGGAENTWGFALFGDAIKSENSDKIRPRIIAYDGSPADLEISWDSETETLEAVGFNSGSSFLKMSPSKWWKYDPGDGLGPIYDEDTGKVLRGFPN